jgi:malic enzyme
MGTEMDGKTTRKLEHELEQAIAGIVARLGFRKLPMLPSQHTMHLMAKAAVAVYEAAVENQRSGERSMAYSESLARRFIAQDMSGAQPLRSDRL